MKVKINNVFPFPFLKMSFLEKEQTLFPNFCPSYLSLSVSRLKTWCSKNFVFRKGKKNLNEQ